MRLALTAAAMLFLSTAAFADEAAAPAPAVAPAPVVKKTSLRVVRVLEETHQALLFDKTKGTHVLVDLGKEIDGFKVDDIDEDTVTLTPIEGGAQVVLAAPDPSWRRHRDGEAPGSMAAKKPSAKPATAIESAPMDPYAEDVRSVEAPDAGIGAQPTTMTAPVSAPISAGEGGVRTAEAPGAEPAVRAVEAPGATAAKTSPIVVKSGEGNAAGANVNDNSTAWDSGPTAAPVRTAEAPSAADKETIDRELSAAKVPFAWESAPVQPDAPTVLAKADITAALANFSSLGVRGSFTSDGARLDAIAPDSLLAKAGLKNGDVILSINNQALKSIDDAANLYARAGSMRAATVQIVRVGKPMSLRLSIR
jgi:membrane-associated protease RseP (regulator of RpoE activity)